MPFRDADNKKNTDPGFFSRCEDADRLADGTTAAAGANPARQPGAAGRRRSPLEPVRLLRTATTRPRDRYAAPPFGKSSVAHNT